MDECARQRRLLAAEFLQFKKVFIALGDETRQQIFAALLQSEKVGMRVPEITKCTHLSRPAVSHHLQVMKDAGLIGMHRVGTMLRSSGCARRRILSQYPFDFCTCFNFILQKRFSEVGHSIASRKARVNSSKYSLLFNAYPYICKNFNIQKFKI